MTPPEVREQFLRFSIRYEGYIPWMYLDLKGLVTVGVGYLIDSPRMKDPSALATNLPWYDKKGGAVTKDRIQAEWWKVKRRTSLAKAGAAPAEALTDLRLSNKAVEQTTLSRLDTFYEDVLDYYPEMRSWPVPAQLGVMSMAWAMGPGFPKMYPNFSAHVRARSFLEAAQECTIREAGNPGLIERNKKNRLLFQEADREEKSRQENLVCEDTLASSGTDGESEALSHHPGTLCFAETGSGTVLAWRSNCPRGSSS